jgi:hypothetical protein
MEFGQISIWPRSCLYSRVMQPKLRLVREVPHERVQSAAGEDRYRYPAHEDVWEVSCEECEEDEKPTLTNDRRRAS